MYKRIDKCLCCNNPDLRLMLDLGKQPLANSFHNKETELPEFDLQLMLCNWCWHNQLSVAVDPNLLFKNYLYVSGTSQTLKEYCDWFADHYTKQMVGDRKLNSERREPSKVILDIACNDGTQLDSFDKLGWNTWGVDPAENLYERSIQKGHIVVNQFWSKKVAKTLPKFDLIIAQNVFAHTSGLVDFLEACKIVMRDDTLLVIQTSQADMFENFEFDTIYHEHINFFSVTSMYKLTNSLGLYLNRVYKTPIHGTSFVFEIGKKEDKIDQSVIEAMEKEGKRNVLYYDDYTKVAKTCLEDFSHLTNVIKNTMNKKIVGYGAAAKGMTVLNSGKIQLDYIVDDNPLKQNLYCPGSNIPIYPSSKLQEETDDIFIVPLAWNFFEEIKNKVRSLRPDKKDKFIRYFPKLRIVND